MLFTDLPYAFKFYCSCLLLKLYPPSQLSMQLQQSSAYWSDKVRQLSSQLEEVSPLHQ